jgi:phosphoglycerate dehydrogenase-like enzyme
MALPFPVTLAQRAENLVWAHFSFARVSNLRGSAFWQPPFLVTSTRGRNQALPIAETTVAAAMMFARNLHIAVRQTAKRDFTNSGFGGMQLLRDKTMAVVGLGGIGGHVAELAKGLGMRVVATRRSAKERQAGVDGVDVLFPSDELHSMLAEADFIAVTAMLTDETERMLNADAFAATKEGAYLLNVARGEIVEEPALIEALKSGRLATRSRTRPTSSSRPTSPAAPTRPRASPSTSSAKTWSGSSQASPWRTSSIGSAATSSGA